MSLVEPAIGIRVLPACSFGEQFTAALGLLQLWVLTSAVMQLCHCMGKGLSESARFVAVGTGAADGGKTGVAAQMMVIPQTCIIEEIGAKSRGGHGGQQIHLMPTQKVKTTFPCISRVVQDHELEVRKL